MKRYYIFFAIIGAISAVMLFYQIMISHRARHDDIVTSDLQAIQTSIQDYADTNKALPSDLAKLTKLCDDTAAPGRGLGDVSLSSNTKSDCTTSRLSDYRYTKTKTSEYQLCATFYARAGNPSQGTDSAKYGYANFYDHNKGYQCFTNSVPTLAVSQSTFTAGASADPNLTMCKTNYEAVDPREPISAIDVPGGSITYTTQVSVNTVVTPGSAAVPKEQSYANVRRWNVEPTVYDSSCKKIAITDLKVGDRVSLYYSTTAKSYVSAIQRLN